MRSTNSNMGIFEQFQIKFKHVSIQIQIPFNVQTKIQLKIPRIRNRSNPRKNYQIWTKIESNPHVQFIASILMTHDLLLGPTSSWPTEVVRRFSSYILDSESWISGKLDEFMQLQKQRNFKFYAFLVDILICNLKLKLHFIIHAKLRIRNDVSCFSFA